MASIVDSAADAKSIVKSFYDGGARGDITSFAPRLAMDFELLVPPQLPWGGRYDRDGYLGILPQVAKTLDFARLRFLSFTSEGSHVVALIEIGVQGTELTTIISEHWDIEGDKATRLLVAYYDPSVLLAQYAANIPQPESLEV